MSIKSKILRAALAALCMISMLFLSNYNQTEVYAASGYEFVVLGTYSRTLSVGDSFYLPAITSTGKKPAFSSGNSKVASVNTYGKITAKKAGSTTITAKIKNGEASCKIVVKKTTINLKQKRLTLENGANVKLTATVSTGHTVTWKSEKKSIAVVDEDGTVYAKKPGKTTVTATVDGTKASCIITVKQPAVRLSRQSISLYRKNIVKLSVSSTSQSTPVWKSNKKSIAVVDKKGNVTAVKHGEAIITVTVDGVSKSCAVTVKKPTITFEEESISLKVGETKKEKANVSSGNTPVYTSSNTKVASVDANGRICAKGKGRAYIYASEDGTKERLTVFVTEP